MMKRYIQILIIISLAFGQEESDPLEPFEYNQSTLQAFYFFNAVSIDGNPIDSDDWVGAFKGDICVGARQWDASECGNGICDVPIMGDDGSDFTSGYMLIGEIPTFKIYDASEDIIYNASAVPTPCPWSNFEF